MSTIKIEFPANDLDAARVFADTLRQYAEALNKPVFLGHNGLTGEDIYAGEPEENIGGNTPAPSGDLDLKGVAFDPEYCGTAKDPFYGAGARQGQWKKRRGLSDDAYDEWYAAELGKPGAGDAEAAQEPINTAGAFGAPASPSPAPAAPTETGEFMGWVSEKQAAGVLTQDQINQAWAAAGVDMGDLFGKPPEVIAANIKKVYDILVVQAGA